MKNLQSKEARVVDDTCRYSGGQLIPIFQAVAVAELGVEGAVEYLQVLATI